MSKLVDISNYIKLSTYSEKYGISNRKLYRYRDDERLGYICIDGIYFIKDQPFDILESNNSGRKPKKSVKNLTSKDENVKNLTFNYDNYTDNQEDKNVKNLTSKENKNVKILTFKKRLEELNNIPEYERSIKEFQEIKNIEEILNKRKL